MFSSITVTNIFFFGNSYYVHAVMLYGCLSYLLFSLTLSLYFLLILNVCRFCFCFLVQYWGSNVDLVHAKQAACGASHIPSPIFFLEYTCMFVCFCIPLNIVFFFEVIFFFPMGSIVIPFLWFLIMSCVLVSCLLTCFEKVCYSFYLFYSYIFL
jgi:hypothetical protein